MIRRGRMSQNNYVRGHDRGGISHNNVVTRLFPQDQKISEPVKPRTQDEKEKDNDRDKR
jgi:hypothetical protein